MERLLNASNVKVHWRDLSEVVIASALTILLVLVAAGPITAVAAKGSKRSSSARLPISELSQDQAILHALNRLGYGARPGDVERVRAVGLENWINQQLNPQTIDDSEVAPRLARFSTLEMSSTELLEKFPQPQQAARRAGLTPDQITQFREQMQRQRQARSRTRRDDSDAMTAGAAENSMGAASEMDGGISSPSPDANFPIGIPPELANLPRPQQIIQELAAAKLTRAIYSEQQLEQVMVDFWFNHFNVFAGKGADRWFLTSYERDAIRPYALGKFEDLLVATAKSPAMLFYLDNWQSAAPKVSEHRLGVAGQGDPGAISRQTNPQMRQRRGLNENYARELMELHTLGVQGGYTQKDVTEVARVLTGWTIRAPRRSPEFNFENRLHDAGTKVVLGKKFNNNGMREGEELLHMLAHHPSTAHFISTKLAERFVSDEPPIALVNRMAAAFLKSDGDIRTVLRTMIYSPEFWSRQAYRSKVKKPFDIVVSTVRALSFAGQQERVSLGSLVQWTARLGEPLYQCQPPNGYSDKAEAWVNTGGLLNRMNFALQAAGQRRLAQPDLARLLGTGSMQTPEEILSRAVKVFLGGQVSESTEATLQRKLTETQQSDGLIPQSAPAIIAGLVLGSPEFQRR